jgi:mannose-6-phosphate isomerase-like protein (cupin superfamily)
MGRRGDVIDAPQLGQKIEFETTGAETNGELTICHHFVQPKGRHVGPPVHIHKTQAEHYKVVTGRFGVRAYGKDHVMGPGEEIDVPAGVEHLWWNDGDDVSHVILEFRPAETIDGFFETFFGLSNDGKCRMELDDPEHPKSRPKNIFQAVALAYSNGIYLCDVPAPIQKFIFPVMVGVGRIFGIRGSYPKYRGSPAPPGESCLTEPAEESNEMKEARAPEHEGAAQN